MRAIFGIVGLLIVLAIVGGLFVLEAVSVIVQVVSFKLTGKRVFLKCRSCHSLEKDAGNMTGPNLWGVLGRKAGEMVPAATASWPT